MPKLEYLSLASNNLQDVISSAIENLTSIVYLHFSNNSLEGELPTTVRNLCTLSFNDLGDNQSGGKISNAFKSMSSGCVLNSLRSLDLTSESFCGHLTDQIVEFKNLESLSLGHNRISGPIPVSLGNFPALQILEFNSNKLDGSLPESLGGEIPRSLQNSKRLTVIDLGLNELVDGIPKWVGSRLLRLEAFSLRSNKLNGHIPFEVSNLPALQIIDVAENSLSGTIPKRINNLKAMANKQDSSKLMGEIPQQLTTLQGLLSLNLSGNFFKGSIQYNIGNPKSLESLDFSRNQLSAIIPSSLSSLSFLSSLNLSFNNLSGKIPSNTPLQNFNASSFIGNELCGPPLTKNCDGEQTVPTIDQHGEEDGDEIGHWFRLASLLHYCCAKPGGMLPLSFLVTSGTSFSTIKKNLIPHELQGSVSVFLGCRSSYIVLIPKQYPLLCCTCFLVLTLNFGELRYQENLIIHKLRLEFQSAMDQVEVYVGNMRSHSLEMTIVLSCLKQSQSKATSNFRLERRAGSGEGITYNLNGQPQAMQLASDGNYIIYNSVDTGSLQVKACLLPMQMFLLIFFFFFLFLTLLSMKFTCLCNISENKMNSSLAIWFSGLSSLVALDLSGNSLQGPLPSSNRNSTALRYLELGACELKSTILNGFLYDLVRLEYLGLNRNNIEGVISSAFQNLTSLVQLKMSGNSLEGEIPTFMGNLASLVYLDLSYNSLEGEIPSSLGNLTSIVDLDLYSNSLEGEIPSSLGNLTSIVHLDFSSNRLGGEIPSSLGDLTSIVSLYFVNNSLEGEIPSTLANLCNLEEIYLSDNKFDGKVLNAFDSLSSGCLSNSLRSIDLSRNSFSGQLTDQIVEFKNLVYLSLRDNKISGPIPVSFGKLSALQLCHLTQLQIMDFADNNLSGIVPKCFINFKVMAKKQVSGYSSYYSFYYPFFNGYLEDAYLVIKGKENQYDRILPLVHYLDLSSNKLTGEIPQQLTALQGLISLNLSRNFLKGRIPDSIGNMVWLESLDFARNQLSGVIPPSLSSLTFLSYLNLSYNNLSGKVPSSTQLQSFNASSFIGNELCGRPLSNICDEDQTKPTTKNGAQEEDDGDEVGRWFHLGIGTGFGVGFFGVIAPLVFSTTWRHAYFGFFGYLWYKILYKYNCLWI
ncbi:hypothetical protein FEM48_Zijuj03G0195600 [Ziziphus jujuba var. spinosa]|uniref:Receptor-like protein 12 n=1 Tax=Ziziphus jujuba var. spinosa TaxID=714518 RepID=A0A978VS76_ZIZJJ|nr:hypothetical protein FEM48_Zijuj03G0195600 [Ziziphus jujuba var. spinosa]